MTPQYNKVTPIKPETKQNNYVFKNSTVIKQFRFIIWFEAFIGLNRLYLLNCRKTFIFLMYIYSLCLTLITFYHGFRTTGLNSSSLVLKNTACIEFVVLITIATFFNKKRISEILSYVQSFDEALNLTKDSHVLSPLYLAILMMVVSCVWAICEFTFLIYTFEDCSNNYSVLFLYLTILMHDSEQIFHCGFLRLIYWRLQILKAHVNNMYKVDKEDKKEKMNKLERLSRNVDLDITSLHKAYELLHKSAELLNFVMSFPMIVIFFCAGLSTTLLLNHAFKLFQSDESYDDSVKYSIIYVLLKCLRNMGLVIFPCYYSSISGSQVTSIQTVIFDAINTLDLDKTQRRKVKAFFQMTQENKFAYALWGVIDLNMSLPLSYTSLCTTYLVIIIQFSKFID